VSIKTNIQKKLRKELRLLKKELRLLERYEVKHRSGIERASTLMLIVLTLFSLSGIAHDEHSRLVKRAAIIVPTPPVLSSAEKNETVRMPIKFDDGLRAVSHVGQ